MLAEVSRYDDWFYAAGFLVIAWSLVIARNEGFEKTNPTIVGAVIARIAIPWSFFSFNSKVTQWAFAILALIGASTLILGLISVVVEGDPMILSNAVWWLTLAFVYCKRPYTLILGVEGFSWHGKSYRWQEVTAWVDQSRRVLQVRVMANERNRLYGALNYLDLSNVSEENVDLLARTAQECAANLGHPAAA